MKAVDFQGVQRLSPFQQAVHYLRTPPNNRQPRVSRADVIVGTGNGNEIAMVYHYASRFVVMLFHLSTAGMGFFVCSLAL